MPTGVYKRNLPKIIDDKRVIRTSKCWLWTGAKNLDGYGVVRRLPEKFSVGVHRVSYEENIGPIPAGMTVCHKCDVRNCVRPSHLWLGSQSANVADMYDKKRNWQAYKTHCPKGHEYSDENTYRAPGDPNHRTCRQCRSEKASASYRKKIWPRVPRRG